MHCSFANACPAHAYPLRAMPCNTCCAGSGSASVAWMSIVMSACPTDRGSPFRGFCGQGNGTNGGGFNKNTNSAISACPTDRGSLCRGFFGQVRGGGIAGCQGGKVSSTRMLSLPTDRGSPFRGSCAQGKGRGIAAAIAKRKKPSARMLSCVLAMTAGASRSGFCAQFR